jgi:hypothetical protein
MSLVPGESFSATVTPALAPVLFDLIGARSGILFGWKGAEEVATLYTSRQRVLQVWRHHAQRLNKVQKRFVPDRDLLTLEQFEVALADKGEKAVEDYNRQWNKPETWFGTLLSVFRVYCLSSPIKSPEKSHVLIPVVPKRSILLNAARASFKTL